MGIKEEAVGEAINLGSGKEHRVIDMANMVNELTGQTLRKFNQQTFRKSLTKNAAQASQKLFFKKETFTKETRKKKMKTIKIFKHKNKLNFGDKYGNKSKSEI